MLAHHSPQPESLRVSDTPRSGQILPEQLGDAAYRSDHGLRYAYAAGAMVKGIASEDLVVRMANARLLSFFGTGGLDLARIEKAIVNITGRLHQGQPFGMNLLCNPTSPDQELRTVELFLKHGVKLAEASAFMSITPALVYYRVKGLYTASNGEIVAPNRIQAKLSRPEVAAQFLAPPPAASVKKLLEENRITAREAKLSAHIPMADDICVEADSGGHTDNGVAFALLPAISLLRDSTARRYDYPKRIRIGAAGGIGTPHAVAAAFIMGADFVLTGSINQCTVEAGTSEMVKDMLQQAGVQDTGMAPAGDMFELGAKVQVLSRGVFFPSRATRLYELYKRHSSLEDIDPQTRAQLEKQYFQKSLDEVWQETAEYLRRKNPEQAALAEQNPKVKMVRVFQSYFARSNKAALEGIAAQKTNFQIHCGPAMGAFNQWVAGTAYESWHNRHVDEIADLLMKGASQLLTQRLKALGQPSSTNSCAAAHI